MDYPIILLRVVLAVVLGGAIGIERQSKHRPAGFRTHILVCLGSATIMLMSEMIFLRYYAVYSVTPDPTRIAAQVVSGIGFLGAGTIIHYGANVKGLTTAASLWAVAAIGLVVGAGFYDLAVTVSVAIYATLFAFNRVSKRIDKKRGASEVMISLLNKPETLGEISLLIAKNDAKILDMVFINPAMEVESFDGSKTDGVITVRLILQMTEPGDFAPLLNNIREIRGVFTAEFMT